MTEFTGERVIPGQVDIDLWNEHLARYLFAARLSRHKRVLDLACGAGYGSATLAVTAREVLGVDRAPEAIAHARQHYTLSNLSFLEADCTATPLPDASFDLVVAFEVIEHLQDPARLLTEARRLLTPGGQFVVSTPNKIYYAESRRLAGPNPFHVHEFDLAAFQAVLAEVFPHVTFFVQNHTAGVLFQPLQSSAAAEIRFEATQPDTSTSHFFLAVCALAPQTGSPAFAWLPTSANVLRERERHIERLEAELAQKNAWLAQAQADHQLLLEQHRKQTRQLEERNQWAEKLNHELAQTGVRVIELQNELAAEQAAAKETIAAYEAKIAELDADRAAKAQWALDTERRLTAELESSSQELSRCARLLDQAEQTVEERTLWAQSLERERQAVEARLSMVRASRWYRMGRRFGLGPEVRQS